MKKLFVKINFGEKSRDVGSLYLSEKLGRYVFAYDPSFVGTGLEISPKTLPLGNETHIAERNKDFYDLFGVFADSLPDEWGKKVQDAEFEKIGLRNITAIDRLAFIGKHGIGALVYEPAQEFEHGCEIVEISQLRKAAQSIISGNIDDITEDLLRCGGSAGGVRPKFLVDLNLDDMHTLRYTRGVREGSMRPFIIKVPVKNEDHWQRIEFVYSKLAEEAGICIPQTYLLDGRKKRGACYAIERFDIKEGNKRFHAHTLAGLLGVNFREAIADYSILLRTTADITKNHQDVKEAYKMMVFNYLGHNKDDHAKNFTFLMDKNGTWSLSPAYDIGYSSGENGLHMTALNGKRRNAETKDFAVLANDFDIKEWKMIIKKVINALGMWKSISKKHGVPEKHISIIDERIRENIKRINR